MSREHLSAADAAAVLERRRAELEQRLTDLTTSFDDLVAASAHSNADDEHDPEGATVAYERSQLAGSSSSVRHHLAEVEAALARLADGTYGRCEKCGTGIGAARLAARPAARRCITCAGARGG